MVFNGDCKLVHMILVDLYSGIAKSDSTAISRRENSYTQEDHQLTLVVLQVLAVFRQKGIHDGTHGNTGPPATVK